MTSRYQWILFDADNTLFDFNQAETAALVDTFHDLGLAYRESFAGLYRQINAAIWSEFEQGQITSTDLRVERFVRLIQAAGIPSDAATFSRAYLLNLARGSLLLPGAEELVKTLRGAYRLGLVTNGLLDVQRPRLRASPIADCFEVVVISDEIGAQKPDGAFFEVAFEKMGQPPRRAVLLVGDGLSADIHGGNGFGLDTCWYNPAGKPADPRYPARYEIRKLEELYVILAQLD
jgi:2-haloacid dehalogenase